MLLEGYRGGGKTSALRKVQALLLEELPEAVVVEIPLRVPSGEAQLIDAIAEAVRARLSTRARPSTRARQALGRLTAVSVMGTGFERAPREPNFPRHPLSVWAATVDALRDVPALCVGIDDAEQLNAEEIGILKTLAEFESPVPLVMVVTGGPELRAKLVREGGSPILRVFSGAIFNIGQFTIDETEEALTVPLRGRRSAGRWERSAVERIQHLTHGYPYLVQCFAAASYADNVRIDRERVQAAIPAALDRAASWLSSELPDASDEDVRTFVKVARQDKSEITSEDIRGLGLDYAYIARLVKQGVLRRLSRGRYELNRAPAIAYFQALRRNLEI
jgi:hypothetical protein